MVFSIINTPAVLGEGDAARVSLRLLILIRWAAVIGQATALLTVQFGFGYKLPFGLAGAVVAASAVFNLIATRQRQGGSRLGDREAAVHLAYDILQLGLLLYLTGGLLNPFAMLMLAPITVAATILSQRSVIVLAFLAIATITVLALDHLPLPWREGAEFDLPSAYIFGEWAALTVSTVFIASYARNVADGARRMGDAYTATQLALAREQRVSAVGALAAAAAHELGSPLGTIAVIAKELVRELPPDSPYAEDAALLLSQSERCRTILAELSRRPENDRGASPYARMPISALVEAAGSPYEAGGVRVIYVTATDVDVADEPLVPRTPEVVHGLGNLIANAIQFAQHEVTVTIAWDPKRVSIDITDDGLGFPPHVLARLGEPYLSSRAGGSGNHMGLGIFIAQTLLQRTGARLAFENLPEGGAHVAIQWNRSNLEADTSMQHQDQRQHAANEAAYGG
jgi:two-component system sensor histidine kinase RegB